MKIYIVFYTYYDICEFKGAFVSEELAQKFIQKQQFWHHMEIIETDLIEE